MKSIFKSLVVTKDDSGSGFILQGKRQDWKWWSNGGLVVI
jgi:hypothetical protein